MVTAPISASALIASPARTIHDSVDISAPPERRGVVLLGRALQVPIHLDHVGAG